jgi:LysM repeat protein
MMPRFHTFLMAGLFASATLLGSAAHAQEPAVATPVPATVQDELRSLRVAFELQSKQIEALSEKLTRLQLLLEARAAAGPTPVTPAPATPGAVAGTPAATPTPPTEGEFAAPAARVVPPNVHIVVKGDSLEKIAKQHGTTVADLLKLNKITDPKKMQIGQQITLPPAAEKKEIK